MQKNQEKFEIFGIYQQKYLLTLHFIIFMIQSIIKKCKPFFKEMAEREVADMKRAKFTDDVFKNHFYFIDDDRSMFDDIECDLIMELDVKDENGSICTIPFSVTRNAFLGSYTRRIYGEVLGTEDNKYRQIEISLNLNEPKYDTIHVAMQAPPLKMRLNKSENKQI